MSAHLVHALVVDDDPSVLTFMRQILETVPCQVETAASAVDAFSLLRLHQFDIVFTDIHLPDIDGYVVARSAQTQRGLKGIVFITGDNSVDVQNKAKQYGGTVLLKPFRLHDIRRLVDTLVHQV